MAKRKKLTERHGCKGCQASNGPAPGRSTGELANYQAAMSKRSAISAAMAWKENCVEALGGGW